MNPDIMITKRDGRKEPIDLEKIHKVVTWAAKDLTGVSVSQVELKSHIQFFDGMKSEDIHLTIIKATADLISARTSDYQYMAARLNIFHLRKKAYGQFEPPPLFDHITKLTDMGKYDKHILEDYTKEEIDFFDEQLDHWRDMNFAYAAVKQMEGKYLTQNRVSGEIYETPQFLYMLVGMCLFSKYTGETRRKYVVNFYEAASLFKISLPTPIMAGVRTPTRQFSSCVLIEAGDSLNSINATSGAIVKYVSARAGIGINAGRIRAIGSSIRNGEAFHTGCIPFYKHFQTAVKSCSQGGVRGGAATVFYPMWHLEVEELLVLKNNRGVEETRVRHMDYSVQFNRLMYKRLIEGGDITLFSPSDVPGLYDAFFEDQDKFEALYTMYEADDSIRKRAVPAMSLFTTFLSERASTGRIYLQNVDHCNTYGPFIESKAAIRQSNLCLEIALPTKPLEDVNDPNGEVALCTLAAFNLGELSSLDELPHLSDLLVRALDALLDYQDYPLPAAERASMNRRTLGIGVINFAYWLAKNEIRYSDGSALEKTHEMFEAIQYNLIKASTNLAAEVGPCPLFNETKYSLGSMPVDRYKKSLDKLGNFELKCDWDELREEVVKHGMRNSTLTALMPSETSSQISNATNGIEPPRGLMSVKQSKDGILKQVVPGIKTIAHNYELLWEIPNNKGYLHLVAIMQKFVDQTISANTNYDPERFPNGKVPMQLLISDMLEAYKLGVKTLYYHNTRDGASDDQTIAAEDDCSGGGCKI